MIYELNWSSYDCGSSHHFEAPEGASFEEFQALCHQLMDEALQDAVDGKPGRSFIHRHPPYWLGLDYGVDEIVERLADHGYKKVKFQAVEYTHGSIVGEHTKEEETATLKPGMREKVIEYNRQMHREMAEKSIRRKMLARTEGDLTGTSS